MAKGRVSWVLSVYINQCVLMLEDRYRGDSEQLHWCSHYSHPYRLWLYIPGHCEIAIIIPCHHSKHICIAEISFFKGYLILKFCPYCSFWQLLWSQCSMFCRDLLANSQSAEKPYPHQRVLVQRISDHSECFSFWRPLTSGHYSLNHRAQNPHKGAKRCAMMFPGL